MSAPCLACGGDRRQPFLTLRDVPVFCNVLLPTADDARAAVRGDLELDICLDCGHVANAAFDPERVRYAEGYENSLHHSPRFQSYAEELASDLRGRLDLDGKRIVEIACGQGDFLKLVCAGEGTTGVGYDPSYRGAAPADGVTIVPEYFGAEPITEAPDLICSRHALEHMDDPKGFLDSVRTAVPAGADPVYFCEVPNSLYSLRDGGVWDFIYEHVSYFNANSLAACFRRAGLNPVRVRESFAGQFLCLETGPVGGAEDFSAVPGADELAGLAAGLAAEVERLVAHWRAEFARLRSDGRVAAVWGAGSKGVTFLNLLGDDGRDAVPVDINPAKHGLHLPGAGQRVVAPADLADLPVGLVLVMNPVYADEIGAMLKDLGVTAEVRGV